MKKALVLCLILAIFLVSCSRERPQQTAVVSQIHATADSGGNQIHRVYTDAHKMGQILNAIRTLGQKTTPTVNPDSISGDSLQLTLTRSDGSTLTYRTKCGRYFRRGNGPWKETDSKKLTELDQLIRTLPSDKS